MSNTGGPAFPGLHPSKECHYQDAGMTLRDYFAAKAMPITYQYWMTDYYHPDAADADIRADDERGALIPIMDLMASTAYDIADAMLRAREGI